jgi:hypothetical protein
MGNFRRFSVILVHLSTPNTNQDEKDGDIPVHVS